MLKCEEMPTVSVKPKTIEYTPDGERQIIFDKYEGSDGYTYLIEMVPRDVDREKASESLEAEGWRLHESICHTVAHVAPDAEFAARYPGPVRVNLWRRKRVEV